MVRLAACAPSPQAERRGLLSSVEDNRRCLLELRQVSEVGPATAPPPNLPPHPQECGHLQAASKDLRALVSTKEETEQKHLRTIEGLREEVQHLKGVELMQRERVVQQGSGKALLEENRALRTERERLRGAIKEFDTELAQVSGGKGVEGKGVEGKGGGWRGGERRGGEGKGGGEGRGEEGGEGRGGRGALFFF